MDVRGALHFLPFHGLELYVAKAFKAHRESVEDRIVPGPPPLPHPWSEPLKHCLLPGKPRLTHHVASLFFVDELQSEMNIVQFPLFSFKFVV